MKFHAANIILRFTTVLHTLLLITRHLPTSPGLSAFTQRGPATLQPWLSKRPPTAACPYKPHQFLLTPALLSAPTNSHLPPRSYPSSHTSLPEPTSLVGQVGLIPGCLMQRKTRALDLIRRAQISPESISFRFLSPFFFCPHSFPTHSLNSLAFCLKARWDWKQSSQWCPWIKGGLLL